MRARLLLLGIPMSDHATGTRSTTLDLLLIVRAPALFTRNSTISSTPTPTVVGRVDGVLARTLKRGRIIDLENQLRTHTRGGS